MPLSSAALCSDVVVVQCRIGRPVRSSVLCYSAAWCNSVMYRVIGSSSAYHYHHELTFLKL
jgi:hypothetical protein